MTSGFDIQKLFQKARFEWLKPSEVLFILKTYDEDLVSSAPPNMPPGGTLFLYNRRVLRFFRKDGHVWRRKKDGRTIGEAHEQLKVDNVPVLSCYYAHGDENPYFQRRSYWMLDPAYEHIVLVHYRDISQERYFATTPSSSENEVISSEYTSPTGTFNLCSFGPSYVEDKPHETECRMNVRSSGESGESGTTGLECQAQVHEAMKNLEQHLISDCNPIFDDQTMHPLQMHDYTGYQTNYRQEYIQDSPYISSDIRWEDDLISPTLLDNLGKRNTEDVQPHTKISCTWKEPLPSSYFNATEEATSYMQDMYSDFCIHPEIQNPQLTRSRGQNDAGETIRQSDDFSESFEGKDIDQITEEAILCSSSKVPSENNNLKSRENVELPRVAINSLSICDTSVAEDCNSTMPRQLFHIHEISPEWAFSCNETTKVLIYGEFLISNYLDIDWKVMFGDVRVSAEVVQKDVLCCLAPVQAPGTVTLYLTAGDWQPCTEVREFEFLSKPEASEKNLANREREELLLLTKITRSLLCGFASESPFHKDGNSMQNLKSGSEQWDHVIESLLDPSGSTSGIVNWLLQELLKDKLMQRLMSIGQSASGQDCSLSLEKGIIHMISGLGFLWALNPVLEAGIGVNFRDPKGWTALHWAAYFGREEMVAALLAAGASAGAITDPSTTDPIGKTAASIAEANGYKGLAGYLSEVALNDHLAALTLKQSQISTNSTDLVQQEFGKTPNDEWLFASETEDQISLKYSLEAARNASQAAGRIQAAFRAYSFRKKQEKASQQTLEECSLTPSEIHELFHASRIPHGRNNQKLLMAVVCIQKRFRGWKSRGNFLKMKRNAVKIQAHVRGYQTRKRYNELLSTVGIFEKAVLRWRRGGSGLRGFSPEAETIDEKDDEDILKAFRRQKVDAALDVAVSRVLSMARSPKARQQYRRMVESYWLLKLEEEIGSVTSSELNGGGLPSTGN